MKKILSFFTFISLILSLFSCGKEPPSAERLLSDFISSYGAFGVIYSKEVPEGERGYIDGSFFSTLYGDEADFESDYAVFLSSSIDEISEVGVFAVRDESSRIYAEQLCRKRLTLLTKMGYGDSSVLLVRGQVIFYSTLPDPERAERIWLDIRVNG